MSAEMPPCVAEIIGFLRQIGLKAEPRGLPDDTFLPGISVDRGTLLFDLEKLAYPGDLLHEAGHLAVMPPRLRQQAGDDFADDGGHEMAAIAWSYAACLHLGLPLDVLFHEAGYKGDASWLAQTYSAGSYIGLPMLVWKGMATDKGPDAYPVMRRWLCS